MVGFSVQGCGIRKGNPDKTWGKGLERNELRKNWITITSIKITMIINLCSNVVEMKSFVQLRPS